MVKSGLFLNAFSSFAFALKKRYFTTIFLWTALFPAAASFPVWIKLPYSKLNAPPMGGWQHKEKDRGRIVVFFSSLTAVFSLSLSSLFLEQHFPRRFSLVVFVLRYTDVYSLTSSVFPTSVFDAHSILWTETASRSLYSPCIRRHDMQNWCLQRVLQRFF